MMKLPVAPHLRESARRGRVEALMDFGFPMAQARFRVHVLVFSGVFLERQYRAFTGVAHGQKTHDFLNKLVRKGFVNTPTAFWRHAFAAAFASAAPGRRRSEPSPRSTRKSAAPKSYEITGDDVWTKILRQLEITIDRHSFTKWILPSTLVKDRGCVIEVRAESDLQQNWIIKHHSDALRDAINMVRAGAKVEFVEIGDTDVPARSTARASGNADGAAAPLR